MKQLLIVLFIGISTFTYAQYRQLSPQATINVVTVGPYQKELYSAFGHSGIRVYDPVNRIDDFYNYGVFDFDQPNFYLNFAKGYLNYRLAVMDYPRVRDFYAYQNRYIHEQVLNLTTTQRQKLYEFLTWNAEPENMNYYYDYFYDNCATRIRDAVLTTFGDSVTFDGSYITTDYTIRDLTDVYLQEQPWGDLGIDICLGLPMDKKATPDMYMFLPDYVESAFNHATIKQGDKEVPLVSQTKITFKAKPTPSQASTITPVLLFSGAAFILLTITYLSYVKRRYYKWIDIGLFTVIGLIGWLLFILWVATDHNAAAKNFNLLWAIPLHFPMALLLLKRHKPQWLSYYFLATAFFQAITLVCWAWLPQQLHYALVPIVIILFVRSAFVYLQLKK